MKKLFLSITLVILMMLSLALLHGYGQGDQQEKGDAGQRSDVNIPRLLMRLMDLNEDGRLARMESVRFFSQADQNRNGFLTEDEIREAMSGLNVGQKATDFALTTLDGLGTVKLSDSKGKKPVVLVFASYTWPDLKSQAGVLEKIYQRYKSKSKWFLVYIRTAQPLDGQQVDANVEEGIEFEEPKTIEERLEIARASYSDLGLSFPAIVDNMDNKMEEVYGAWPGRLYVVDKKGNIAYKGKKGPEGFNPQQMAITVKKICSN